MDNHRLFQDLVEPIKRAGSRDDLFRAMETIQRKAGFELFSNSIWFPDRLRQTSLNLLNNIPETVAREFLELGLLEFDEGLNHCRRSSIPLVLDTGNRPVLPAMLRYSPGYRRILSFYHDQNASRSIALGVHGADGICSTFSFWYGAVLTPDRLRHSLHTLPLVQALCPYLHQKMVELSGWKRPAMRSLTPREKACLLYAGEGLGAWEISEKLKVSVRTVRFHLDNAANKLGATNRTQAVANALLGGLL